MKRGLFITFEGPDGAGKTTQIGRLRNYLAGRGIDAILTREPGGTNIGEQIRDILLDADNEKMTYLAEALLYAASRAQHVEEKIRPSLNMGKTVICDRFVDSSIAYQGYGRKLGESVTTINNIAAAGLTPDLTFLILLDPDKGRNRIKDEPLDRLEMEEIGYHLDVYEGYKILADENKKRIHIIDGSKKVEEISEEINERISAFLDIND